MRRTGTRTSVWTLVLMLAAGCASGGSGGGSGGGTGPVSGEELMATNESDLYNALQRLRPNWLRPRGSQVSQSPVALFVDGAPRGTVNDLRSIQLQGVVAVRFYNASEAGFTFGTMAGSSGVVEVLTR